MVFKIRPSFYVFALRWSISSLYERTAKHKAKQEKADTDGSPKESHCVTSFSEIIFLFFNLEEIWDYASKRGQQTKMQASQENWEPRNQKNPSDGWETMDPHWKQAHVCALLGVARDPGL